MERGNLAGRSPAKMSVFAGRSREAGNGFAGSRLGGPLDQVEEKRLLRGRCGNRMEIGVLHHPMPLNQCINNIAAAQAPVPVQTHRMKTFLKIDQVIRHHQTFTSRARHESPPFGPPSRSPSHLQRSLARLNTSTAVQPGKKQCGCHRLAGAIPCLDRRRKYHQNRFSRGKLARL